jgi:hypothetical protein
MQDFFHAHYPLSGISRPVATLRFKETSNPAEIRKFVRRSFRTGFPLSKTPDAPSWRRREPWRFGGAYPVEQQSRVPSGRWLELPDAPSGRMRLSDQAARSNCWSEGLSAIDFQPSTLRIDICPEASKAQNSIAAVSAQGRTVCVLIRRLNSSCTVRWRWSCGSSAIGRAGSARSEQLVAGFFKAVRDGRAFQPPLADEGFASRLDFRLRRGVNHVRVVGRDFLVQPLGRVRQQVAVLVNRAALDGNIRPQAGQRRLQA